MVCSRNWLAGKIVERASQPLRNLPAVDEEDGGMTLPNEFQQPRMNCVPDRYPARCLRSWPGRDFLHCLEARHILNWNFNPQL